jgi:hypothetical protein
LTRRAVLVWLLLERRRACEEIFLMDRSEILSRLDADACLLEPREFFDDALVGATDVDDGRWPRTRRIVVAVYDVEKCIAAIVRMFQSDASPEDDVDSLEDDAMESFWFNTEGAWIGEGTPMFVQAEIDEDV